METRNEAVRSARPSRRFVVLRHEPGGAGPRELHWDLMLEAGDHLRTWALDAEPSIGTVWATALPAHRKEYLDYQGPISGDRGRVSRLDAGRYELASETERLVEIDLYGERLRGRATLQAEGDGQRWTVTFSGL